MKNGNTAETKREEDQHGVELQDTGSENQVEREGAGPGAGQGQGSDERAESVPKAVNTAKEPGWRARERECDLTRKVTERGPFWYPANERERRQAGIVV